MEENKSLPTWDRDLVQETVTGIENEVRKLVDLRNKLVPFVREAAQSTQHG